MRLRRMGDGSVALVMSVASFLCLLLSLLGFAQAHGPMEKHLGFVGLRVGSMLSLRTANSSGSQPLVDAELQHCALPRTIIPLWHVR